MPSGDGLKERNDGRVELGTFSGNGFKNKNDRLTSLGKEGFRAECE